MSLSPSRDDREPTGPDLSVNPVFIKEPIEIPRDRFPSAELDANVASQLVHDELLLDGNPRLNLATFGTTWMELKTTRLENEALDKNAIDRDEYPRTAELEIRCVRMLAGLWHAPDARRAIGWVQRGVRVRLCPLWGP
jgi:glutamate decarboxylase